MQAEDIKTMIESAIPSSEAEVRVEGNHVHLVVVSPEFAGKTPVKKQQLVYGVLNDHINDGTIHAVHMKTYTPEQYSAL